MQEYLPQDLFPISLAVKDCDTSILPAVREGFLALDRITGRNVSSRVTFARKPFPYQRQDPYDSDYYGVHVKWMRIFRHQMDSDILCAEEEVVIDLQEDPILVFIDTESGHPGHTVYAAYQACCIALLAQEQRPSRYRNNFDFAGMQEDYIKEACTAVREELLQDSFPYLESISVSGGSACFAYWGTGTVASLLAAFPSWYRRYTRKILRSEYPDTENADLDRVILQALEKLRSLSPISGSLCAVPCNSGFHGRCLHGYPRICIACVDPEAFLCSFHPRTNFRQATDFSPLASEDPTGDENVANLLGIAQDCRPVPLTIPDAVTLLPIDETYFEKILGTDISCLCEKERCLMAAELVLAQSLALLGIPTQAQNQMNEMKDRDLKYQLSAFYCSLRGRRRADAMFRFAKSGDAL